MKDRRRWLINRSSRHVQPQPTDEYTATIRKANDLAEKEQWERAAEYYQNAIKLDPERYNGYQGLGYALVELDKSQEAIPVLQKASELNPDHQEILSSLGWAYHLTQDYEKAVEAYQKALNIDSTKGDLYFSLGLSYEELGNRQKAIEAYQESTKYDSPRRADSYHNLGMLYKDSGDYDEAIEAFNRAIEAQPELDSCYYNLGSLYAKQGLLQEAREQHDKLLRLKSNLASELLHNIRVNEFCIKEQKSNSIQNRLLSIFLFSCISLVCILIWQWSWNLSGPAKWLFGLFAIRFGVAFLLIAILRVSQAMYASIHPETHYYFLMVTLTNMLISRLNAPHWVFSALFLLELSTRIAHTKEISLNENSLFHPLPFYQWLLLCISGGCLGYALGKALLLLNGN